MNDLKEWVVKLEKRLEAHELQCAVRTWTLVLIGLAAIGFLVVQWVGK